jgi:Zn-dependent protease with chaperone function
MAVLGLLLFVGLYVTLTGWFAWTAFACLRRGFPWAIWGGVSTVIAVFLLKALFFVRRPESKRIEISPAEEPRLFAFLHRLADEAGAPRPHRVFLSPGVNASVSFDLSVMNLLFPVRKDLEIGVGLVNVLSLSETAAVLGHEFGHFAQRSTAVGGWVYVAQQIAGQVVVTRDWLDRMLIFLSRLGGRILWMGWLLRLVVWSIRSLLDTVFGLVVLAERALSREMELQADRVAVAVTGSDALVHALYRLGTADDAFDKALVVLAEQVRNGRAVPDVYALQERVATHMRRVLDEPGYGLPPPRPETNPGAGRVFAVEMVEPPRMWSTHPPNREREDNAKRPYVSTSLDDRSAFCLFGDPPALRRRLTEYLVTLMADGQRTNPISDAAAEKAVDAKFDHAFLDARYRGVYLGRSVVIGVREAKDLYGPPLDPHTIAGALEAAYSDAFSRDLRDLRHREREKLALEALKDGILEAPGGVIRVRGKSIKRSGLSSALYWIGRDLDRALSRVAKYDCACRTAHRSAAAAMSRRWEAYLYSLGLLLHYAGHQLADILDASGYAANVLEVATASGSLSRRKLERLVVAFGEVHAALSLIHRQKTSVGLPSAIRTRLKAASWSEALGDDFRLPPATASNLAEWVRVIDSWVGAASGALGALESATLEALLETENHVGHCFLTRGDPGDAPDPAQVPDAYTTRCPGDVRPRQTRLDMWDRFLVADGIVPTMARLGVALGILGSVFAFGGARANVAVTLTNERYLKADVRIGDEKVDVDYLKSKTVYIHPGHVQVYVVNQNGTLTDRFVVDVTDSRARYLYNLGSGRFERKDKDEPPR